MFKLYNVDCWDMCVYRMLKYAVYKLCRSILPLTLPNFINFYQYIVIKTLVISLELTVFFGNLLIKKLIVNILFRQH